MFTHIRKVSRNSTCPFQVMNENAFVSDRREGSGINSVAPLTDGTIRRAVRQRTVRQNITMHSAGTLLLHMYQKDIPVG